MQKNKTKQNKNKNKMTVTGLVSEKKRMENYPDFEKLALVIKGFIV